MTVNGVVTYFLETLQNSKGDKMNYLVNENNKFYFSLEAIDTLIELLGGKQIILENCPYYSVNDNEHENETGVRCYLFSGAKENYYWLSAEDIRQSKYKMTNNDESPYNEIYLIIYEREIVKEGEFKYSLKITNGTATKLLYFTFVIASYYDSVDEAIFNFTECIKKIVFDSTNDIP